MIHVLYTFTAELRQTPSNADLQKLSSSALLSSCQVPRVSLHLYYIRTFKYYINGGEDINFGKHNCLIIGNCRLFFRRCVTVLSVFDLH